MINLKDCLHLYANCEMHTGTGNVTLIAVQQERIPATDFKIVVANGNLIYSRDLSDFKPILYPLSEMTDAQLHELCYLTLFNPDMDEEDRLTRPEVTIDSDTGETNEMETYFSCRCLEGKISITENGSVNVTNDDGEVLPMVNQPAVFAYLLSQKFDLFGLIESGQAISCTATNDPYKK